MTIPENADLPVFFVFLRFQNRTFLSLFANFTITIY